MKSIYINFVDFWDNFKPEDSFIYKILSKKYNVILSEKPDYLFCSVFGDDHLSCQDDCIKIFYTGENFCADYNVYDYAIDFNYQDFSDRHYRFPLYYIYKNDFELMIDKIKFQQDNFLGKTGFCSFVYSNNFAHPSRESFLNKLSEYKKVASGGRYRNNVGGPVADKLIFQKKHKFSIAFENCSSPGYTTEKLVQSFASQTIPIYWGDPLVNKVFNTKAFINCHDYNNWDEVIERIIELDSNDKAYIAMMQQPALLDANDSLENAFIKLGRFLEYIIDQPKDTAQRYNRYYWGRRNINNLRLRKKIYNRSLRGIAENLYSRMYSRQKGKTNKNILFWKLDRLLKKVFGKI